MCSRENEGDLCEGAVDSSQLPSNNSIFRLYVLFLVEFVWFDKVGEGRSWFNDRALGGRDGCFSSFFS